MLRRSLLLVSLCLFSAAAAAAQTLDIDRTTFTIDGRTAVVNLSFDVPVRGGTVGIDLELVDPDGNTRVTTVRSVVLDEGLRSIAVPMALGDLLSNEAEHLSWFRLRYTIGNESGIISLSDIFYDDFTLRIASSEYIAAGTVYRVTIDSLNPTSLRPVSDVRVEAVLSIPSETAGSDIEIRRWGITDNYGSLYLDLPVAPEINFVDPVKVKVTGTRNGLSRRAEEDLALIQNDKSFLVMSDKTIYQPGQTVHVRGILLNGLDELTVAIDKEIELRIEDEDNTVLFRQTLKTSEFGVASTEWEIPKNAKLGDYAITARIHEKKISTKKIKVSRYDLPNFIVAAKPDKSFYLPDDTTAEVTVSADYIFGKPVTNGKVRVVEEKYREWNFKKQQYDIREGESTEGITDEDGVFVAKFDIREELEEFFNRYKKDSAGFSDRWWKYEDLHFTAYVTDPTTNRTEQRRFDVRITDQPIHVYYSSYNNTSGLPMDLPASGFFAAYYADGTPAECDIEITVSPEDKDEYQPLAKIRTNRYGVALLNYKRPPFSTKIENVDLRYLAVDKKGSKGAYKSVVDFDNEDAIQFTTDKAIYKPGENIEISLISNVTNANLIVQVIRGISIVDTHRVKLSGRTANLTIPYNDKFRGPLKVLIFDPSKEDLQEAHGLVYPSSSNLRISASFDRSTYKPGDEAKLNFSVTDAHGDAAESVLGVTIFDKAVSARTEVDGGYSVFDDELEGLFGHRNLFSDVDLKKPIPEDLQLAARRALSNEYYEANVFGSQNYYAKTQHIFQKYFDRQFKSIANNLDLHYKDHHSDHPTDDESFTRILGFYGQNMEELRDPWGEKYFAKFGISRKYDTVTVLSKGIDKMEGTDDDLQAYSGSFESFTEMGKAIDTAVKTYHERTGGYIRDLPTLFAELGVTEMIDRLGRPYYLRFYPSYTRYVLEVNSVGEDGVKNTGYWYAGDDFTVWKVEIDFADDIRARIDAILKESRKKPANIDEFRAVLTDGGLPPANIRDGFNRPVYITMETGSRYSERAKIVNRKRLGEDKMKVTTVITPVTEDYVEFIIRSIGSDGKQGTYDDFTIVMTSIITAEYTSNPKEHDSLEYVGLGGAITGVVKDSEGDLVPGIEIQAYSPEFHKTISADESGYFSFTGLPPGSYEIKTLPSGGFATSEITNIIVTLGRTTDLELIVYPGQDGDTVDVTAGDASMDTTSSELSGKVETFRLGVPDKPRKAISPFVGSTPRLREYFPETLLWRPDLVTDKDGKITANFKMADNITTWKMYAIASDRSGRVALTEGETSAFRPFFIDLDPPRYLTKGDVISLPVQIRNYTEAKQAADVSMAKGDWFSISGGGRKRLSIPAGSSENAVFKFTVERMTKDGKQRVTAIANGESDAVEKPVTVSPNGRKIVDSESAVFSGTRRFEIDVPGDAIKDTATAEIKIYPNLLAHIVEAQTGLLRRPVGCGEQTISTSYPNLMMLRFPNADADLKQRALKNLQAGYERLLGYRSADGGFTYWGGTSKPSVELTAYALRFLIDAKEFIAVDADVINDAEKWLLKRARADGWHHEYEVGNSSNTTANRTLTTYIVRTLAMLKPEPNSDAAKNLEFGLVLVRGYSEQFEDPYRLALYGLAAADSGHSHEAVSAAERLVELVHSEGAGEYWNLETNTVFYGWGKPARIETTALAIQLLSRVGREKYADHISRGLVFLLNNKDIYGVWYSTQTTVNVLDSFVQLLRGAETNSKTPLRISVNGDPVKEMVLEPDAIEQQTIDISAFLHPGKNSVEIAADESSSIMAQTIAEHYVKWDKTKVSSVDITGNRAVMLRYDCGSGNAAIMETITCTASVERVGFKGYGMLIAELGVPPGADIDRKTLDDAMTKNGSISRYEVLPDRIIIYLYAKPGGTTFTFSFRPRYGIDALAPASSAYDYYNPLARAEVEPMRFVVK